MTGFLFFVYFFCFGMICILSLLQLHLAFHYKRSRRNKEVIKELTQLPSVTIQLPVYNEKYVVSRLLDAIASIDYPHDLLEVQILDDSDDETSAIINRQLQMLLREQPDRTFHHIRRPTRSGYKAGALQYGLDVAKGEFIAIFDADFSPPADFLKMILPKFSTAEVGMVQTRWGHLNEDYNLLTRMQAFGLNTHFTVEQSGRHFSGKFINFNGTGGIWRKKCIEDAGGWTDDTLTEDLDLSYRAQLQGWKFVYAEDLISPGELPVALSAVKSQQYRWNKGAAETARKHLPHIIVAPLGWAKKLHATAHLLNSSVFLLLLIAAVFSVPLLYMGTTVNGYESTRQYGGVFLIGLAASTIVYWVSFRNSRPDASLKSFLASWPLFLTFSMGLSLHNSIAVVEGYLGIKTPFVRTPKFNIPGKKGNWKENIYLTKSPEMVTITEGLLALYFFIGVTSSFLLQEFSLILFHSMMFLGFLSVFVWSVRQ